jgi:putative ABC transport system permease protein
MDWLWKDFAYAARGLRKQPGFAFVAILTLALGIGSATTIFSAIQNILLDPFPYTDARKVVAVQIHDTSNSRPGGRTFYQTPEFLDLQEQSQVFSEVIGGTMEDVLWNSTDGMEQFTGGFVTPNTFQFLGVPAMIGRGIVPEDARAGAPPVFVMAYKMWVKRFNSDPAILGRTYNLNGTPATLVGIMPKRFTKLGADLWMARAMDRADKKIARDYWMFQAKLKPGITNGQARAELDVVVRRLAKVYPDNYPKSFSVEIVSWVDSLVGPFKKTLYTIAAAVTLLLLIACGNVANMLLARATAREKEMAIRSSLGAGRARLIGQLLSESLLLALGGAAVGCLFSYAGIKGLVALIPDGLIPREAEIRMNLPVLLFSLGTAMATALIFGLAPAFATAKKNLVEPLKDSGKGVSGGFRKGRLRNALVVAEVALSLVLLSGAGLLIRSFIRLQTVDLGFNPQNILVARLPFPRGQYESAADKQRFFRELLARLQRLPGVTAATETTSLPPYGGIRSDIDISGKTHVEKWQSVVQLVSEGYFPTLQLRLVRGRLINETEVNAGRKVAVINQKLVSQFLPNDEPIGKLIRLKMLESQPQGAVKDAVFEVVGIVADAKNQGIQDPPLPEMFVPYTITGNFQRGILVRTSVPPLTLLKNVQSEIWTVDRNVALTFSGSLEDFLKQFTYAEPRFGLVLMAVFAGVGLLLVALGVFSVIAYTVSRQTHEIGVRMALGAGRRDVLRMVFRMGGGLLATGVVLGLLGALAATRVMTAQLWGISPRDPLTLITVVAVVGIAGLAACYFPAQRATRVDPLIALRYE